MCMRILFALIASTVLMGCTSAPIVDGPLFQALEPPPDGYARVYLFRPGFSQVSVGDTPALSINKNEVANLIYESYLSLALAPGTHTISLKPTLVDSSVWNVDYEFSVEAGRTYFVAVWNSVNADGGRPVWIPVLPIPGTPILLMREGRIGGNTGIRVESVAEGDALPVLRELRLVKPKQEIFPRP